MTNVQKLVDIANKQAFDMCKGDAIWLAKFGNNPYTIVNGEWHFNEEKLDVANQVAKSTAVSFLFVQQVLAESVA